MLRLSNLEAIMDCSPNRFRFLILTLAVGIALIGDLRAQTDVVSLKSSDTSTQINRLVVTSSTAVGALANVRVEQSRLLLGSNAIFQLGTYTPGSPGAGDVRYSGGNVLYYDSSAWQTLMQLGPATAQASSSANPCIHVDETNAGAPNLMTLKVAGASRFTIANSGSFTASGHGLPAGNNTLDLGSASAAWNDVFVGGTISFGTGATRTSLAYAAPGAARTITFPDATGTVLLDSTASGNFVSSVTGSNGITPASASTGAVTLGLSTTAADTTSYVMNQAAGTQSASFRIAGSGQATNTLADASNHYGFFGTASGAGTGWNIAIYGVANNSTSQNWGVLGDTSTSGGKGIYGRFLGTGSGTGVSAANNATGTGGQYAISGQVNGSSGTGTKYALHAQTLGTATTNYAVYADAQGVTTTNYGIYARALGATTNWAGYFDGNVNITGALTVAGTADPYVDETGDTMTGNLTIASGAVIDFNDVTGERILLYGAAGVASSYTLGVESSTLFYRANGFHRWYVSALADGGVGESMELDSNSLNFASKEAIGYGDSWLRLNNASSFTSGVYTPGLLRADGGFNVDNQTVIDNDGGWHRSYGATGWYNGTYGGGWYMTDTTWVRTYSNSDVLINDTGDPVLRIQGPLNSDANIGVLQFNEDTGGLCGFQLYYYASSDQLRLYSNCGSSLNILNIERGSGDIGIRTTNPAYDLHLANNSAAKPTSSSWTVASDRLLKTDIFDFEEGLDIVRRIHPVWYRYNGLAGLPTDEMGIGVIAQELQEVMPWAVKPWYAKISPADEEETELLAVDDYSMNYVIINAIQELDEKDDRILERLRVLEEENRLLRQRLERTLPGPTGMDVGAQ